MNETHMDPSSWWVPTLMIYGLHGSLTILPRAVPQSSCGFHPSTRYFTQLKLHRQQAPNSVGKVFIREELCGHVDIQEVKCKDTEANQTCQENRMQNGTVCWYGQETSTCSSQSAEAQHAFFTRNSGQVFATRTRLRKTVTSILRKPAQSKCTWSSHKSHFMRGFSVKLPQAKSKEN